jgi:hypothetical protein
LIAGATSKFLAVHCLRLSCQPPLSTRMRIHLNCSNPAFVLLLKLREHLLAQTINPL